MAYDVVVVGCGVVGLFIAYELAERGFKVAVVDKYLEPGWGVSRRHAGVIHVIQLPFRSYKSRLARRGNKKYLEICRRLGVRCVEIPALLVVDKMWKIPLVFLAWLYLRLNGVKGEICVKCGDFKKFFNFSAAVVVRGYKIVDSFGLIYALYDSLKLAGVEFYMGCRVVDAVDRGRLIEIVTTCGSLRAKFLVNAAGLYADELARKFGVDASITPGKGVLAVFSGAHLGAILAPLSLKRHPKTKGGAVVPTVYGTVMLGPSFASVEDKEDVSTDEESFRLLLAKFSRYIKDFDKLVPIKIFAGNRPLSPTGDLIVEKVGNTIHILGTESPLFTGAPALAEDILEILHAAGLERRDQTASLPSPPVYPRCGKVVCMCRGVTECEIREAVRRGSTTLDGVMARLGVGTGVCQGSRCIAEILKLMSEELKVHPREITKFGEGSWLVS